MYDHLVSDRELKADPKMPSLAVVTPEKVEDVVPPIGVVAPAPGARSARTDADSRLRGMVDEHLEFVARVLRNAGTPQADIDDEVQRTFIIAARRLDDVRAGAEKSFLFRIALNLAAHVRRTLARRREVSGDEAPERVETLA